MEKISVTDVLTRLIADEAGLPPDEVTILTKVTDLGLDSLEFLNLMEEIEKNFPTFTLPEKQWHKLDTVGDIARAIA